MMLSASLVTSPADVMLRLPCWSTVDADARPSPYHRGALNMNAWRAVGPIGGLRSRVDSFGPKAYLSFLTVPVLCAVLVGFVAGTIVAVALNAGVTTGRWQGLALVDRCRSV